MLIASPAERFELDFVWAENALRRNGMKTLRFGIAVAAALFVLPVNAQIQIGPGGVRIGGGGRCEELRRACENKGALGEQGEGNCADIVRFAEEGPNGPPDKCALNCVRLAFTRTS